MHRILSSAFLVLALGVASSSAWAAPDDEPMSDAPLGADPADEALEEPRAPAPAEPPSKSSEPSKPSSNRGSQVNAEPNFFEKYYPLQLPDDLEPEVEEATVMIWLLSIVCAPACGSLWAPAVLTGGGFPADYVLDMFIGWLVHYVPVIALNLIPLIGTTAGGLLGLANCFYLCPVATISIYDRNLKAERAGGTTKPKKSDATPTPPDGPRLASAAMAY